jgi:hypothetical protein
VDVVRVVVRRVRSGRSLLLAVALAALVPACGQSAEALASGLPPVVEADGAQDVNPVSATLNGTVDPEGQPVSECVVEYGTSTSYGADAPCEQSLGEGTTWHLASATVTGLAKGTLYHYRLVATGGGGTGYGADASFQTPEQPVTLPAFEVLRTSAWLNGSDRPEGEATGCWFEWGLNEAYGSMGECSFSARFRQPTVVLQGLAEGTVYHYRIGSQYRAHEGTIVDAGHSYGADMTFKTLSHPPTWGVCSKLPLGTLGTFIDKGCTEAFVEAPRYQWREGVLASGFSTALSSETLVLEAVSRARISCTGEHGTGDYSGLREVTGTTMVLTGCDASGDGLAGTCSSAGAAPGEIVSAPLSGVLGVYLAGSPEKRDDVGLQLAATPSTAALLEASCGGQTVAVSGSVIVPLKTNLTLASRVLTFTGVNGKQRPERFLEAPVAVLDTAVGAGAPAATVLKAKVRLTSQEAVEVNAAY